MEPKLPRRAHIIWDEQGEPNSADFDDVYFAKEHGLAETHYVFIEHNNLSARFSNLAEYEIFVIGETGFGTGLNFLAAWQLWRQSAPASAHLHFISAEKYPLSRADLTRAVKLWPELTALSEQLLAAYPPVFLNDENKQYFRCCFSGNVHLTIIFDDATAAFSQFLPHHLGEQMMHKQNNVHLGGKSFAVDAWFLDGFAPAKNPSMWQKELFIALANLSAPGTTLTTFTVAAIVKKGLAEAGFAWQKQPGFRHKRAMLTATCLPFSRYFPPKRRCGSHWHLTDAPRSTGKNVLIIGGGMAGCHTAFALAERGFKVTLTDAQQLASGGSGNSQGVVYATLSHTSGPFADFNLAAFLFSCRYYQINNLYKKAGAQTGLLDFLNNNASHNAITQRFAGNNYWVEGVTAQQASTLAGVEIKQNALWFPQAGWLNPKQLCRTLADHTNIHIKEFTEIKKLTYNNRQWHCELGDFDQVIIASAQNSLCFEEAQAIKIKSIRGQVTTVKAIEDLRCVLCGEGYIAPAANGVMSTGASFNPKSASLAILDEDRTLNLFNAAQLSTRFNHLEPISDRAGLRCVTPDYLPIVGPLPRAEFLQQFKAYNTNRLANIDEPASFYPQLYCIAGLGSRGLTYSPLAAVIIAALITGEPLPISIELWKYIHPARFWVRDLTRGIK
ncbi:MAG: bifunctional tRNA (5-methylaminomethyl-2-thiouridine)(34)-methyltransferase MnmD/FAD-dependent [Pseudomonadota bacterium]|jgi:tRNA 5-methylaminomethyl-2-thiouridine biosynthesis bifunctional protein